MEDIVLDEKHDENYDINGLLEHIIIMEDYDMLDRLLIYTRYNGYKRAIYLLAQYCKRTKYDEYMDEFFDLEEDGYHCVDYIKYIRYDKILYSYIQRW